MDKKKEMETAEAEVQTLRGETQQLRFDVEELTSQLKHYNKACSNSNSEHRFKNITVDTNINSKFIVNQLKQFKKTFDSSKAVAL